MLISRERLDMGQRRAYVIEYPWLNETEVITILSVSVADEDADGIFSVEQATINIGGKDIRFIADAGTGDNDGTEYVVTINVTTNEGQVNNDCVRFLVSCDGCC